MKQDPKWVEFFREQFPHGTRVRLIQMNDPYSPVEPDTLGTLDYIDDQCTLHVIWDNGRTLGLIPGVDRFSVLEPELKPMKLFMPLTVDCYERDRWGDLQDEPTELDNRSAAEYESQIFAALVRERMPEERERGIMNWYHEEDGVNKKIRSAEFSVENIRGSLWGTVNCEIKDELTQEELKLFKNYVSGQASDGWGEGFEQRPIKIPDGELYVHLWSGGDSWRLYTEDEFQAMQGQQMGGLSQ